MRFEIDVPDSTGPELQKRLKLLSENLSARPEFVEEIPVTQEEAIEALFTPERLAIVDRAVQELSEGKKHSLEEVRARLEDRKRSWIAKNAG